MINTASGPFTRVGIRWMVVFYHHLLRTVFSYIGPPSSVRSVPREVAGFGSPGRHISLARSAEATFV